ncbi:MAG: hypothetical protein WAM01_07205 [Candidatus Acidiferrales bacterium]
MRNLAHRAFAALISKGAGLRGAVNLRAARFPLSTSTEPNLAGAMAFRMAACPAPISMDAGPRGAANLRAARSLLSTSTEPNLAGAMIFRMQVFPDLISMDAGPRGAVNLRAARSPLSISMEPNLGGAMAFRMPVFPDLISMDAILEMTHFASQKDFRVRNFHIPVSADARRADATTRAARVFPARDLPVRIRANARN